MSALNSFLRRNRFALLLAFSTAGCEMECNPSKAAGTPVAPTIQYASSQLRLWETLAMTPQVPTTAYFFAANFSIEPALPAGLEFSVGTGAISGTPRAAQPQLAYRVDAYDAQGVQQAFTILQLEVLAAQAPSDLSYSPSAATVEIGSALTPLIANLTGAVESFSVVPALPDGLNIDQQTGRIAGTCFGSAGLQSYQVTAANPFGSAVASVSIEVLAGPVKRSLLIPSLGDRTLDVFDQRGAAMAPIDAVWVNQGARAVAPTSDGRWVFIATQLNRLLRCSRDPSTARLGDPEDLGDVGAVRHLAITSDGRYLIAAGDGFVTRFELDQDGAPCCSVQASGPFAPSALELSGDSLAIVASSAPGELRVYELLPTFAQRGPALNLGSNFTIGALENHAPGASFFAATSTYNEGSSSFSGVLLRVRISTPEQILAGHAGVFLVQAFNVGAQLTSLRVRRGLSGLEQLLVVDRSLSQLQVWDLNSTGDIVAGSSRTHALAGTPSLIAMTSTPSEFWVLDENDEMLRLYFLSESSANFAPALQFETRTRRQPSALVPVLGQPSVPVADQAFVTSAGDSTLRAVVSTPGAARQASAAAQGPIATSAAPRAVGAHPRLDVVYTANSGAASLGVYAFGSSDLALTLIEEEALAPSARPISLALTPSGRHLHALDENGRVLAFEVDGANGELDAVAGLTVQGSMVDGRLRADRLGRFVFVVQPTAGRVTSLTVNLPTGFLLISNFETGLPRPIDLWTSPDGRFAYVLDAQLASVFTYSIDRVSGSLIPQGTAFNLGGSPTRLVSGSPGETILSISSAQELLALDGALSRWLGVWRGAVSGALQSSPPIAVYEHPADAREFARMTSSDSLSVFNLVAIEGAGGARLASGYDGTGPSTQWVETASLPLGPGPHAIATRTRMR